jgi:hypothetical protein
MAGTRPRAAHYTCAPGRGRGGRRGASAVTAGRGRGGRRGASAVTGGCRRGDRRGAGAADGGTRTRWPTVQGRTARFDRRRGSPRPLTTKRRGPSFRVRAAAANWRITACLASTSSHLRIRPSSGRKRTKPPCERHGDDRGMASSVGWGMDAWPLVTACGARSNRSGIGRRKRRPIPSRTCQVQWIVTSSCAPPSSSCPSWRPSSSWPSSSPFDDHLLEALTSSGEATLHGTTSFRPIALHGPTNGLRALESTLHGRVHHSKHGVCQERDQRWPFTGNQFNRNELIARSDVRSGVNRCGRRHGKAP